MSQTMELYRKVNTTERLPESDCLRFVIDENGARFSDRFVQGEWYSYPIHPVKYWLEPIEITEEEMCNWLLDFLESEADGFKEELHFSRLSQYILSKLKGG